MRGLAMNIVMVQHDVYLKGWVRPVTVIMNEDGEVLMTEFATNVTTGHQDIQVMKPNNKGFNTFSVKG